MSGPGELLGSPSSFQLAAFFVSWAAVALLGIITFGLHVRVARLEQAAPAPRQNVPFATPLGRSLRGVLPPPIPRLALVLSSGCNPCRSLLADLAADHWQVPTVIAWKDAAPSDLPSLPTSVRSWEGGRAIVDEIGVQSEPLALVLDNQGRIVEARPTSSLSTLRALLHSSEDDDRSTPPSRPGDTEVSS